MRLVKDYMRDDTLRHELNALTQATFGFDFEKWVTEGGFEGDYIPYSLEEDGRLLSNVSANIMDFQFGGEKKRYIQIGTVMTAASERGKGYARRLVRAVLDDWENRADGVYLFANLNALGFYEKLGFQYETEYRCVLKDKIGFDARRSPFVPAEASQKDAYRRAVRSAAVNAAADQLNRFGLQMFYTADLDGVYYCGDLDCWIVLEKEENNLFLQSLICARTVSLREALARISVPYETLTLGFTPLEGDEALFERVPYDGADDYRLFCMGGDVRRMSRQKLIFPALSHA